MIPFFPQERPESCVPACMRMVLANFGNIHTEAELYACCQTDIDGTLPSAAAECAESLGFKALSVRLPDIDTLIQHTRDGYLHPIVFVNLSQVLGLNVLHAVIIDTFDANSETVQVIDPAYLPNGQRTWRQTLFINSWRMARGQTFLIRP